MFGWGALDIFASVTRPTEPMVGHTVSANRWRNWGDYLGLALRMASTYHRWSILCKTSSTIGWPIKKTQWKPDRWSTSRKTQGALPTIVKMNPARPQQIQSWGIRENEQKSLRRDVRKGRLIDHLGLTVLQMMIIICSLIAWNKLQNQRCRKMDERHT